MDLLMTTTPCEPDGGRRRGGGARGAARAPPRVDARPAPPLRGGGHPAAQPRDVFSLLTRGAACSPTPSARARGATRGIPQASPGDTTREPGARNPEARRHVVVRDHRLADVRRARGGEDERAGWRPPTSARSVSVKALSWATQKVSSAIPPTARSATGCSRSRRASAGVMRRCGWRDGRLDHLARVAVAHDARELTIGIFGPLHVESVERPRRDEDGGPAAGAPT